MPKIIGSNSNREAECTECGTKMSFLASEVRAGAEIQGSDGDDFRSVISCPQCHKPVDVTTQYGITPREKKDQQQYQRDLDDHDYI